MNIKESKIKKSCCVVLSGMILTVLACSDQSSGMRYPSRCLVCIDTLITLSCMNIDSISAITDYQLTNKYLYILDSINKQIIRIDRSRGDRLYFGTEGEAPGGLINPICFVVTDDFVRVVDTAKGIVCYDTCGTYLAERSYYASNMPINLVPSMDNSYIGVLSQNDLDDNGNLVTRASVGLYQDDNRPIIEYYSLTKQIDIYNIAEYIHFVVTGVMLSSDENNGSVYVALRSSEKIVMNGFSSEGDVVFSLIQTCEKVQKSDDEIELEELEYSENPLLSRFAFDIQIDPYRSQVRSLGVDSLGNIWVQNASESWPTFDIVSPDGKDTIYIAEAPLLSSLGSSYDISVCRYGVVVRETSIDGSQCIILLTTMNNIGD